MYAKLPYKPNSGVVNFWERLLCTTLGAAKPLKQELKEYKNYGLMPKQEKYIHSEGNISANEQIRTENTVISSINVFDSSSSNRNVDDVTSSSVGDLTINEYR